MLAEPIAVTIKVTTVLEELGIVYLIGGSLASTRYGTVRTTQDSDIVAQMGFEHLDPFVRALEGEFYVEREMIMDAIEYPGRQPGFCLPSPLGKRVGCKRFTRASLGRIQSNLHP